MSCQQTVAAAFSVSGVGIHTGVPCRVTVHPAEIGTGRMFRIGSAEIPARAEYVVDTTRSTLLGRDGVKIGTVEHLLSALFVCDVDNAIIEATSAEIPIMDGSALPFLDAIQSVGVAEQPCEAPTLDLQGEFEVVVGRAEMKAAPAVALSVEVKTAFDSWPEGESVVNWKAGPNGVRDYRGQVAPARTFAFRHEVDALLSAGLAKGGSLDNVLIITPPATLSSPLRVPAEWCAHKLLDILGDLSLTGSRLVMAVRASRPGHRANTQLAAELLKLRLAQGSGR